uniref:Uncharacterized protein n=1 Tax=uncultured Rhizobium sp. HF0500_10F10 TaxID=723626 RepID=E7C549_9HYPH|nr:hypothetical protein [uncultured Rhizobium sp. HF0500_10F10]
MRCGGTVAGLTTAASGAAHTRQYPLGKRIEPRAALHGAPRIAPLAPQPKYDDLPTIVAHALRWEDRLRFRNHR